MTSPVPTESSNALTPDFDAVRDKRMSELSSAQQDDARELWLRENLKSMGPYHQDHYGFLLKRLDEARADHAQAMGKAVEAPPPQPTGSSLLKPTVDSILWQRFAKAFNRYDSGDPEMPFSGLRRHIDELLVDVNRFLRSIPSARPQSPDGRIAIDLHVQDALFPSARSLGRSYRGGQQESRTCFHNG